MSVYLSPGVYIEEIPSGSKPIEAVATSTAAFVGPARKGPTGQATLIHSLDEYKAVYGEIASDDDAMGLAVRAFYMNGGKNAYICRLVSDEPPTKPSSATFVGQGTSTDEVLTIEATSAGEWGDAIYVRVIKPDPDALTFTLEVGHREDGELVADEVFSDLSMDALDERYLLTQVNGISRYVVVSLEARATPGDVSAAYQDAVLTGGTVADTIAGILASSTGSWRVTIDINGLGAEQLTIPATAFATLNGDPANLAADAAIVATAITNAVKGLGSDPAYQSFLCRFSTGRFVLRSAKAHAKNESSASIVIYDGRGANDLAALLRLDSKARATLEGAKLDATNHAHFTTSFASATESLELDIDGHGGHGPFTIHLSKSALALEGVAHARDGALVAKGIRDAVRAVNPEIPSYRDFHCTYTITSDGASGYFTLTSGSSLSRQSSIVITGGPLVSALGLAGTATAGRTYVDSTAKVIPREVLGAGKQLTGGTAADAGAADYGSFFHTVLRKLRDVSIILLPGQTWAADGSGNAIISEALAHCEATKSRMVIIDPPKGVELEQAAQIDQMGLPSSTYGVMYYPWVKIANPLYDEDRNPSAPRTSTIAPSAFAAGIWSKTDGTRGVWKAPAGVETQLLGIAGLDHTVEEGEQAQLNPLGVNCIRKLPGFGSVIWGSRTLATKAKPEWRYVPVRRTAIFIERSIYEGIQWAVFEPNDAPLWSALRINIESFMNGLFRAGAFQGAKASDAYFVRCGLADTMTQGDIDRGQVIVIVGFAPLKPAEFVIVRIQQKVGQQ